MTKGSLDDSRMSRVVRIQNNCDAETASCIH